MALEAGTLPRADVVAVDLDTRGRSERAARRIVREAFASHAALRAGIVFKKIDSTLRGHVVAELTALLIGPLRVGFAYRVDIVETIRNAPWVDVVHVAARPDAR